MSDSPSSCPRGVLEQAVCHRLCSVVAAFHELCQSALPDGPCTEMTLKVSDPLFFEQELNCYSQQCLQFLGKHSNVTIDCNIPYICY